MPKIAKVYIGTILVLGAYYLSLTAMEWRCSDALRYEVYAALAILAACIKVRLPGIHGTMSLSFVLVLIGTADLSFSETVAAAAASGAVQTVWRCKRRPKLVQVAFNMAVLAISAGAAHQTARVVRSRVGSTDLLVGLTVAACVYFVLNTFMVSQILALLQQEKVMEIWKNCHLWSFPYYLVGAAVAALGSVSNRSGGWPATFLCVPLMTLVYVYYRLWTERGGQAVAATKGT